MIVLKQEPKISPKFETNSVLKFQKKLEIRKRSFSNDIFNAGKMKFLILLSLFISVVPSFAEQKQNRDREEIRQVMKKNLSSFKACYDQGLPKNPNMKGKVVFEWEVLNDGSVGKVELKSSELNDEAVQACLIEKLKALKFLASKNGELAVITYPMVFSK